MSMWGLKQGEEAEGVVRGGRSVNSWLGVAIVSQVPYANKIDSAGIDGT